MKTYVAGLLIFVSVSCFARDYDFSVKSPELMTLGKKMYQQNCTSCHGTNGNGRGPASRAILTGPKPRNFNTEEFRYGRTPAQVFTTITNGSPGSAMPPWGNLSVKERWALAHFVLSLRKN